MEHLFFKKLTEKNSEGKHLETQLNNQKVPNELHHFNGFLMLCCSPDCSVQ